MVASLYAISKIRLSASSSQTENTSCKSSCIALLMASALDATHHTFWYPVLNAYKYEELFVSKSPQSA